MIATNHAMSLFARYVFWFVALNAFGGALSLLLFPTHTEQLFFWTITPPINARLLGALYLSGALAVGGVAWRGEWDAARFLVPVLVVAGALISIVTLLHLDRFTPGPRLFYWLLVYVAAPLLVLRLFVQHQAAPPKRPAGVALTSATRRLAVTSGALIMIGGLAIIVWPAGFTQVWPWPISALMLRLFAAWFSAFGAGLLWFQVERDWRRLALLAKLMLAASSLELLIIVLHRHELKTTGLPLWLYCAHLGGLALLGLLMHWLQRDSLPDRTITLSRRRARSSSRQVRRTRPYH